MSNTMPRPMNTASTSAATTYPVPSRAVVEKKLSSADSTTASTTRRIRSVNVETMNFPITPAPRRMPSATSFAETTK